MNRKHLPGPPDTAGQSTSYQRLSSHQKRLPNPTSENPLLKNAWQDVLRALARERTDVKGMPNTIISVLESISTNFSKSVIPVNKISEGICSARRE